MRRSTRLTTAVSTATKRKSTASPQGSIKSRKLSSKDVKSESRESSTPSDASEAGSSAEDVAPKKESNDPKKESRLADKKYQAWSTYAKSSPFPDFSSPSPEECKKANSVLHEMHHKDVKKEFQDENTPETIPHVLDAMIVALLSAATGWNNAERAMNSMKEVYGGVFEYPKIFSGGKAKVEETIKCGGLHVRKSKQIMDLLEEVQKRHGKWDMDYMLNISDEDAMQELMHYKGMGPKCASVVMNWCLKRTAFTVDTHVFRIAGLWGWIPDGIRREKAQSHLEARIPMGLKSDLHFLFIAHGRPCPACRAPATKGATCEARKKMKVANREQAGLSSFHSSGKNAMRPLRRNLSKSVPARPPGFDVDQIL